MVDLSLFDINLIIDPMFRAHNVNSLAPLEFAAEYLRKGDGSHWSVAFDLCASHDIVQARADGLHLGHIGNGWHVLSVRAGLHA